MGSTMNGAALYRVLALPAARLAAACAAGVVALCLFAGAVRILPLVLGPGLPLRAALPLARAALGVSLETALFVAPSLAWALASAALVDRGEARALFSVGARPLHVVASAWPSLFLLAIAAALASGAWGASAAAPGRLARELVAEVRSACGASIASGGGAPRPVAYDVPSLGLSWVCFSGDEPRIVGPAPFGDGGAVLSATGVHLSDDLRAVDLDDLSLSVAPSNRGALSGAHLRVGRATIRGIPPLGRASNLTVARRAALFTFSSALFASLAAWVVLALSIKSRVLAGAIGLVGPASALMLFSTLEREANGPLPYLAVPLAGLIAIGAAFLGARQFRLE